MKRARGAQMLELDPETLGKIYPCNSHFLDDFDIRLEYAMCRQRARAYEQQWQVRPTVPADEAQQYQGLRCQGVLLSVLLAGGSAPLADGCVKAAVLSP